MTWGRKLSATKVSVSGPKVYCPAIAHAEIHEVLSGGSGARFPAGPAFRCQSAFANSRQAAGGSSDQVTTPNLQIVPRRAALRQAPFPWMREESPTCPSKPGCRRGCVPPRESDRKCCRAANQYILRAPGKRQRTPETLCPSELSTDILSTEYPVSGLRPTFLLVGSMRRDKRLEWDLPRVAGFRRGPTGTAVWCL